MTEVKTNKYGVWFAENWFTAFCFLVFVSIIGTLIADVIDHRNGVRGVSTQNPGCIYLESSDLGDGQHYMICDGQIVLKRLAEEGGVEPTTEEKLEEAVPTEAKPTTPAK
jgi:hypothetical protein